MKKEHSSRYYETRGYTLFGMVVASHVEDRRDLTDDEKTRLIALMEKHRPRQPHVLIEMHVVVSEDTVHDPAAVQHYNDVILIPHLLAVIEGFATGGIMHMCLDGAPTQFDNRWMYLWASKMWTKYGVRCDYVIGCANHNKDLSDGECGLCKNCINRVNVEHNAGDMDRRRKIDSVPEVKAYLDETFTKPLDGLAKKKGRGVYRRVFHHVPLGAINRRLPSVATLKGSKKRHHFMDVGEPGKLLWRIRPCHTCDGCLACDAAAIIRDCKHKDRCGQAAYVTMKTTGSINVVLTRSASKRAGVQLCKDAAVGDFIIVELDGDELPWMVGEVMEGMETYDGADVEDPVMGTVKSGDKIIHLRRWMPLETGGGCNIYECTETKTLAFVEDVRYAISRKCADKKEFKKGRAVLPECSRHHKLVGGDEVYDENECDICGKTGTSWVCKRRNCDYDLCAECKEIKSTRRNLHSDTKKKIFSCIPNCDADPYADNDGGDVWAREFTTREGMSVEDVAAELHVSIESVLDNNGNIGLTPSSKLRTGTVLWAPGEADDAVAI